jgi:hypothetical protein
MRRVRVIVGVCAAVVVVVLVLVMSSGGGGGGDLVSGSALADAAKATQRVPGASVSMDETVEAGGLSKPLRIRLHGVENMRQRAADLVGAYTEFPRKVPGQRADGSLPVETIVLIPHVYMRSPLFGSALPSGKSWLDLDLAKVGRRLGLGDPTQFGNNTDPGQTVRALRAVSSRVERLGTENVRGVATTHYRGKVELRRLPAVTPAAQRPAARRMVAKLTQLIGTDSYPIEVWVDRRHLMRRARMVMDMKVQGTHVREDMTTDMFDFGPKQKIKPPPASDVYDATKLATGTSAGGP